jgi:hypothetical protein
MALPPEEVAKHIAAFERDGDALVRGRLDAGQTLKRESYAGELAVRWLEDKRLQRERDLLIAAQQSAAAAERSATASEAAAAASLKTARWTFAIALATVLVIVVTAMQPWFATLFK